MARITITFDDREIRQAFERLAQKGKDPRPALKAIGESLMASTKRRFATSTGPDGQRWAPNQESTLTRSLSRYKGSFDKRGRLTKKGAQRVMGKKPLIGESKALGTTINYQLIGNTGVAIGSPMEYASVQQLGAKRGEFGKTKRGAPIPWGDIPARPYLGISSDDRATILEILEDYLNLDD